MTHALAKLYVFIKWQIVKVNNLSVVGLLGTFEDELIEHTSSFLVVPMIVVVVPVSSVVVIVSVSISPMMMVVMSVTTVVIVVVTASMVIIVVPMAMAVVMMSVPATQEGVVMAASKGLTGRDRGQRQQ